MAEVNGAKPYLKLFVLFVILALTIAVVRVTPFGSYLTLDGVVRGFDALRATMWAPVVFVLLYASATAVALPGSVLTIAGGAVFGFWGGALLNTIGANIGASAAFILARVLGRDGIEHVGRAAVAYLCRLLERVFGRDRIERVVETRIAKMNKATEDHGFLGLLILRLVPLVPFNALNFGSGFTQMRWRDYTLATVIGILPGTLVYTFFADALVQSSTQASHDARVRLWIAAGLLVALSLIPVIAKRLGFKLPSHQSVEASS